uniref:Uncharacterized protein DDB_G0283357-like n=1 Tax=Diabrotica virgifera virgifera TaxID=50390 RepID=A0A6P7HGS8_DIAVI
MHCHIGSISSTKNICTSERRVNMNFTSQNKTSVLSKNDQKACSSVKDKLKYFDNLIEADENVSEVHDNNENHFGSVSSATTFGGFSNAAGKQILVSADSLSKVKSLFDNIDSDLNTNYRASKEVRSNTLGDKSLNLQMYCDISSRSSTKNICTSETKVNMNFDSQNNISMLSKNDQKACSSVKDKLKYFDNLIGADENVTEELTDNKNQFGGFSNAAKTFEGFSNAAGKQISVSADSLNKVKSLFDNSDNDFNLNNSDLKETQETKRLGDKRRNSQRFSNIKNVSLPNSHTIEGPKMNYDSSSSTLVTKDYQKASITAKQDVKKFDHLEEDLSKPTENALDGTTSENLNLGNYKNSFTSVSITNNNAFGDVKKFDHLEEDLSKPTENALDGTTSENLNLGNYKNSFTSASITNNNAFGGFCKASGKELIVTSNALSKAKALFEDMDIDPNLNLVKTVKPLSEQNTGLLNHETKTIYHNKILKISGAQENNPLQPKHNDQSMSEVQSNKGNASVKDKLKYFDQLIGDDLDFVPKTDSKLPNLVNKHSTTKPPT